MNSFAYIEVKLSKIKQLEKTEPANKVLRKIRKIKPFLNNVQKNYIETEWNKDM